MFTRTYRMCCIRWYQITPICTPPTLSIVFYINTSWNLIGIIQNILIERKIVFDLEIFIPLTKCRKVIWIFSVDFCLIFKLIIWLFNWFDVWLIFKYSSNFERIKNVEFIGSFNEMTTDRSLFSNSWELTKNSKN